MTESRAWTNWLGEGDSTECDDSRGETCPSGCSRVMLGVIKANFDTMSAGAMLIAARGTGCSMLDIAASLISDSLAGMTTVRVGLICLLKLSLSVETVRRGVNPVASCKRGCTCPVRSSSVCSSHCTTPFLHTPIRESVFLLRSDLVRSLSGLLSSFIHG